MCIVTRGWGGDDSWQGYRSVEVLAHHASTRKVEISFLLFLNNKKENNYLQVLHPGNGYCKLVKPWDKEKGLPYHIDEEEIFDQNMLNSVYRKIFVHCETDDKLYQRAELNPNESLFDLEKEKEVTIWPDNERLPYGDCITELYGTEKNKERFIPFTTWKLGPFSKTGLVLVAFRVWFQGKSYDALVGDREYFPVDGPDRLRSKIKHDFIPSYMGDEEELWQNRLKLFEDYIYFQGSYDVIIFKKPPDPKNYHIEVDLEGSCEIALAASDRQPKGRYFPERYVTMDDRFKLNLYYQELRSYWREQPQPVALGRVNNTGVRKE